MSEIDLDNFQISASTLARLRKNLPEFMEAMAGASVGTILESLITYASNLRLQEKDLSRWKAKADTLRDILKLCPPSALEDASIFGGRVEIAFEKYIEAYNAEFYPMQEAMQSTARFTLGYLKENVSNWDEFCKDAGIDPWCLSEGTSNAGFVDVDLDVLRKHQIIR